MQILRSEERGFADHGWLKSYHTFSFANYYNPQRMGFRALRVINDDRIAAKMGFGTHPHNDMEIITYVMAGAVAHKDSMGNGSTILPGEVQRMSAGTGVTHSEFNAKQDEETHLLQIWILPDRRGYAPGYEQKSYSVDERQGKLRLVASQDGRDGSVTIHQDANLYASILTPGQTLDYEVQPQRFGWLHVARGGVRINGEQLHAGDAVALVGGEKLTVEGQASAFASELLLFDLA